MAEPTMDWGSDLMAQALRDRGVEWVFINPGSSFRGLHDSLVNYLGDEKPKMALSTHEASAVAMAHGYAKASGKPGYAILHNLVGLMNGSMSVFNAFCDQTPLVILGGSGPADPDKRRIGELLEKSEPEDLLKFGLIPEFVGRLPVIATLHDLDVDALVTILQEPKNAIVKQYRKLFELEDVELTFTDDALREIAERAIKRKTGARGLRSIVEAILLDTMFDLPDMDGVSEIVIDKDVVDGRKEPIQVLGGEDKKEEAA